MNNPDKYFLYVFLVTFGFIVGLFSSEREERLNRESNQVQTYSAQAECQSPAYLVGAKGISRRCL